MRFIPSSVIATRMEVITASDAPHQEKELIRLICEQKKELLVPRSLLIQSSAYFAAILSEESVWEESTEKTIELDAWPRNDLAAILRSLKTKDIEPIFKNVNHYFAAIHYFLITPLLEQCIEFKIRNISDDSVIDDLELAERFSVAELKDECMKYLLRRLPKILRNSQESRRKMTAEFLRKLLRHENLASGSENEVLSLIDIWCSSRQRKSERVKLLHEVRFAHLTERAFEKCRQDAQCLEVPQFRLLLESPRWSDLDEDVLSGRNSNRVHYHIVGLLPTIHNYEERKLRKYDEFATGVFVHCSKSGSLIPVRDAISEVYARSMIDHNSSVMYGKGLFVLQRHKDTLRRNHRVQCFTGLQYYSDFRDSEPTSTIRFPKSLYAVAPPIAFENDLFIVHMPFKKHSTLSLGCDNTEKYENLTGMEILRFRDGKSTSRRLQVPVEYDPQPHPRGHDYYLEPDPNKLFVSDKWTILLLASQGVLVVIDSPHPVGPIIEIPEMYWKMKQPHFIKIRTFTDLVIVGNVAYVLMRFNVFQEIWDPGDRDWFVPGEEPAGSLTAYDLTEGKWLPDHFVDLEAIYSERRRSGADDDKVLQYFLKVVQNEVFLIVITPRVDSRESGFLLAAESYVYRLEHSADGLCLIPASDGQLKPRQYSAFTWQGYPLNIDAHLCEYATALQCRASREEDPIEREKLRRFIW